MATRAPNINIRAASSGAKDIICTWPGMANGDDGQWVSFPGAVLRSTSVRGTLGAGGSTKLNACGSDAGGQNPITGAQTDESVVAGPFSSLGTTTNNVYTSAPAYRPQVTAGDGTTNLTFVAYFVQD